MICGIILASGFSRRFGKDKLIQEIDGEKIIEKIIKQAKNSNFKELIIVYRNYYIRAIADKYNIKSVHNIDANKGQSSSLKKGILANEQDCNGFMFLMGDQPFLKSEHINRLIDEFRNNNSTKIIVPRYLGVNGSPVIFPTCLKECLLNISGDTGGKKVINKNLEKVHFVNFEEAIVGKDIDTLDELRQIKDDYYE
ncbi:nucleotidyltransferase family protein [Tepidibacter mesophilus]|uniref:nucleotidyltransferase family protein n=1 Tax=Tepidibacter mesophilus TaxID=655607 RepID=UPI0016513E83|nr:nucleotidyltransferase family protein [Tepidibacter mesophilus]